MNVVSLCPLSVSSLPWQPRRGVFALTVICKATFSLRPGVSQLAATQDPVWNATDRPFNDMVPFKRRADVLVVGKAYPPPTSAASASIVARFVVGNLQKATIARADRGWSAEGLGPIEPTSPLRTALLGRHAASWDHRAWHTKPMPDDLDGAFFNVAPADQQLAELTGDERIWLEYLHPSQPRFETKLEHIVPQVTVRRQNGQTQEIRLRCDTLWIDTDRRIAMLVWRGVVVPMDAAEQGIVSVALEGTAPVHDDVDLTHTLAPGKPSPARESVLPFVPSASGFPNIAIRDEGPRKVTPVPSKTDGTQTLVMKQVDLGTAPPVTPFEQAPRKPEKVPTVVPVPPVVPIEKRPEEARTAPPATPHQVPSPAHVFVAPSEPAVVAPASPREEPPMIGPIARWGANEPPAPAPEKAATLPEVSPVSAAISKPEPEAIELTLVQCATLAAELAQAEVPRAKLLEEHGLTEKAWQFNEQRWKAAIDEDAPRGKRKLRGAYDAAYVARVEGYRGIITLEDYAKIVVAIERGTANATLDALRIQKPAQMPIVRLWTQKVASDMKLAAQAAEALRAAREE